MDIKLTLSEKLEDLIAKKGKKASVIAREIDISESMISKYRNDKQPTLDSLVKLARYFNVSTDYLLGLTDAPSADVKARAVEEYTGLSSDAVQFLHDYKEEYPGRVESLSNLLQSEILDGLLLSLANLKVYCNTYPAIIEDERKELTNLSPEGLSACQVRTYKRRQNFYGELWAYSDYAQRLATVIYPITETRDALDKLYEELSQKGAKDDGKL